MAFHSCIAVIGGGLKTTPLYAKCILNIMSKKKEYKTVYVIVRIDYCGSESINTNITNPFPNNDVQNEGPNISFNGYSLTLKEIVSSVELAEKEVIRLNQINSDKNCKYFWQGSRQFPENKSFRNS